MVILVLDPMLGTQRLKYEFKRDSTLESSLPKILALFQLGREDGRRFVLQLKTTSKFVDKSEELCTHLQ